MPKRPHLTDDYRTGTFREGIVITIIILAVIGALWLGYGWALNQPGISPPQ